MRKLSLLTLVNQYIDDEKKRNDKMRSKSAISEWINEDVKDELVAINNEYREINNDIKAKNNFKSKIIGQFKTEYFKKFLKNKSETPDYYDKLLNDCLIHVETVESFLNSENDSNQNLKTLDFFTAFCKHQQREHGEKELIPILPPIDPDSSKDIKTETLKISGATIINEEFIEKVKAGIQFTEADFYSAKQTDFCQWYGIIHEYDVVRKGYYTLKNVIIDSFIEEKHQKVTAIICGSGGSGKSTVLRRTAVDLQKELIHIVWVGDSSIKEFVENGFLLIKSEVEKNKKQKFLIIIEDWYRTFTKENEQSGIDILRKAKGINNIRIIIGDRIIKQLYTDYRNNDFELHLSSDDNKRIIEKIVEKYPDWKLASEKLLKENNNNFKSSLFLLLFILARIDQQEFKNETLNLSEPQQIFQRIIESDLRFIEKKYKGLAKALYYWGCVYAEHKIFISYETFLHIADFYTGKENTEVSDLFTRWDIKNAILDRLKVYINKNKQTYINENIIQFNHDILADIGLRNSKFEDWDEFDDTIKIQLLKIITDKGDDYSASNFLGTILSKEENIFKDQEEKLSFVKKLILKNNYNQIYLYEFSKLQMDNQKLIELAQLLWDNKNYNINFWEKYFIQIKNDMIFKDNLFTILSSDNICEYNPEFISIMLEYYKNIDERNDFIVDVLSDDKLREAPAIITMNFLKYATCETLYDFLKKRLQKNKGLISQYTTFRTSLMYVTEKVTLELYKKILYEGDLKIIRAKIITECLYYVSDKIKQDFCKKIFQNDYWKTIDVEIIGICLYYATDEMKQDFCGKILQENNWKGYDCSLIYFCLKCYENKTKIPKDAYNIIDYIISCSDKDSITATNYLNLLKINFQQHPAWRKRAQKIIQNWETKPLEIVVNIILSHQVYPDKIFKICSELLTCWKKRFDKMNYFRDNNLFFEASLIIAMGHPYLRDIAKQTATEVFELRPLFYNDEIKSIITKIVENDIYPEWEI